jgi:hypothetical protein
LYVIAKAVEMLKGEMKTFLSMSSAKSSLKRSKANFVFAETIRASTEPAFSSDAAYTEARMLFG